MQLGAFPLTPPNPETYYGNSQRAPNNGTPDDISV
jgi:hypothetical protein